MTKTQLVAVLESLGVRPSRKLGQNFLIDDNMLEAMVRQAEPQPGEPVLEVGPGTGVLTRKLLAAGCHVTAVELDHRLAEYLRGELGGNASFRLIEEDACKLDYRELMGDAPFRCIANLPYACSSVFIARLLETAPHAQACFLLLQREMAERLAAEPGTKAYGALSVRVQLRFAVDIVRMVPPNVFYPPPEVGSAFVRLAAKEQAISCDLHAEASAVAILAFSQRRKKALRVLAGRYGLDRTTAAFQEVGIDEGVRAERLPPETFARLAACLGDAPPAY
jgi:16S rRNA (adenine1518-N6/adenine1519-N6)-dimethyltransferase